MKAEATDKHPAQVGVYYEDVAVGFWRTVKFSGALPAKRVGELLERVEKLQQAVKFARERQITPRPWIRSWGARVPVPVSLTELTR